SLYFRIRGREHVRGLDLRGPELKLLQHQVEEGGATLMITTPVANAAGKLTNSTLLFRPGHPVENVYSKVHLFDVDVVGAPPVRESDVFAAGQAPRMIEVKGWKIGLSICYDLRFAELYSHYAQKVDLILIPSAFLVPTGEAHWHVLIRARAIEN